MAMEQAAGRTPEREAFYDQIGAHNMAPLWERLHGLVTAQPTTPCQPAIWHYREVRPYLMQSGGLITAYPQTVVGLKDSSGDWRNTSALLERFPGFAVFPGSEVFLLDGLRKGAAGCITASGNVNVPGIKKVYDNWRGPRAEALQAEITTLRNTLQAYPMVPALKRIVAHYHNDPSWAAVRPPLVPLDSAQSAALITDLGKVGFALGEHQAKAA